MLVLFETFVTVVESGSISKAAEQLTTTQPSVTRRVQLLEEEFGVPLFDRIGKRLILNKAGSLLFERAKLMLKNFSQVRDDIRMLDEADRGNILIGAGLTINQFVLPTFLYFFHKKYPKMTYKLVSGNSRHVLEKLLNYEIDVGLITTDIDHEAIERLPLKTSELVLIAPFATVFPERALLPDDLREHSLITYQQGTGFRRFIDELFKDIGLSQLPIRLETDSIEVMVKMVENEMGLAVVPKIAAAPPIAEQKVKPLTLQNFDFPKRSLSLIYRKVGFQAAAVERFIDELKAFQEWQ
ncbi:LysR family transcriptional regulator [Pullulanibacillus sp. KACC 23026]|uniref:LysR family transcriptional regulator n=1 Tax=Pullulanibacillus sp. KACC 23026 TaxID=3028315 RepID=UPI0023AF2DB9|nr:LysR family transcriptional regulator [Pullulanibacillus sp. KACC 23026]WEG14424.1 LysR family transcriptional regulator [Pullulanibacillus sp. KACC 23026]